MRTRWILVALSAVLMLIALAMLSPCVCRASQPDKFQTHGGPNNMLLYDSPYYYPNYPLRAKWDIDGRCVTYCGGPDGDCPVVCR